MKNILITSFVVFILLPQLSRAQDKIGDIDLSASWGYTSGTEMLQGLQTTNTPPNFDHPRYYVQSSNTGNIFLTGRVFLSRVLALGITAGMQSISFNEYTNSDLAPTVHNLTGKFRADIYTVAFEVKPIYYNGRFMQLYGLIGLGGRYENEQTLYGTNTSERPQYMPNTQWTPIGFRAGRQLSGFLEVGVGYKGLINAGVCYKLTRHKAQPAATNN